MRGAVATARAPMSGTTPRAMAHLFPELERTLRRTEFNESQDDFGHQTFRSALPIRPVAHDFHARLGRAARRYL